MNRPPCRFIGVHRDDPIFCQLFPTVSLHSLNTRIVQPSVSSIPFTVTFICMEPSRPAAIAAVAARVNAEPELPLRIRLHAHESAELCDAARCEAIGAEIAASDAIVVSHVMLDDEVAAIERLIRTRAKANAAVIVTSS